MPSNTNDVSLYASSTPQNNPPISFFFHDTATTEIYTLSLHDALPISFDAKKPRRLVGRDKRLRRQGRSPQLVGSDNRCRSRNSFGTISSLSSGTRFQRHSNDRVVGPACTVCQHSRRLWMLQTSRVCMGRQRQGIHCKARGMLSWRRCTLTHTELGWTAVHVCYTVLVRASP